MKILVLGADGMLGHKICQLLHPLGDIFATSRSQHAKWINHPIFAKLIHRHIYCNIDTCDLSNIYKIITDVQPQVIINCIGVIKQRETAKLVIPSVQINTLFPHYLANFCQVQKAQLIHLSTDCVFSGNRGRYIEEDFPDPIDLYGRTKLLGELDCAGCLTLRTSIIGWELSHQAGLLEWFASQRGQTIKGYRRAIYTGLSTTELAKLIRELLENHPDLSGLYHVASQPTTKYELLVDLREALGWHDINIEPDDTFECDRSLVSTRFEAITHWRSPSWDTMITELATEWSMYQQWKELI